MGLRSSWQTVARNSSLLQSALPSSSMRACSISRSNGLTARLSRVSLPWISGCILRPLPAAVAAETLLDEVSQSGCMGALHPLWLSEKDYGPSSAALCAVSDITATSGAVGGGE